MPVNSPPSGWAEESLRKHYGCYAPNIHSGVCWTAPDQPQKCKDPKMLALLLAAERQGAADFEAEYGRLRLAIATLYAHYSDPDENGDNEEGSIAWELKRALYPPEGPARSLPPGGGA